MRPDLDNKEWPVPLSRDPKVYNSPAAHKLHAVQGYSVVREGYLLTKQLAMGGISQPIAAGECAITSLALTRSWLLGATSGERVHLFGYCMQPANEVVVDIGPVEGHTACRNAVAYLRQYGFFAGMSAPGKEDYAGGEVLVTGIPRTGSVIQEWGSGREQVKSLGIPVAGEGIACLIADPARGRLFGLSDRTGTLFSLDPASEQFETHGQICGTAGLIVRFDPDLGTVEDTNIHLPSMAGRQQYAAIGAWALDPKSGLIYAGDVADGLLSALDVRTGHVRVLGKPTAQPHIRALAVIPDGRVYGVAGLRGQLGHLFCYTPAAGEMRDLGVMTAGTERRWYGYEFDCAVAGPDGRVYFGESDRISHLFVYFPPLLPVTGTESTHVETPGRIGPSGSQL